MNYLHFLFCALLFLDFEYLPFGIFMFFWEICMKFVRNVANIFPHLLFGRLRAGRNLKISYKETKKEILSLTPSLN